MFAVADRLPAGAGPTEFIAVGLVDSGLVSLGQQRQEVREAAAGSLRSFSTARKCGADILLKQLARHARDDVAGERAWVGKRNCAGRIDRARAPRLSSWSYGMYDLLGRDQVLDLLLETRGVRHDVSA